jgi:hypothetical protein
MKHHTMNKCKGSRGIASPFFTMAMGGGVCFTPQLLLSPPPKGKIGWYALYGRQDGPQMLDIGYCSVETNPLPFLGNLTTQSSAHISHSPQLLRNEKFKYVYGNFLTLNYTSQN